MELYKKIKCKDKNGNICRAMLEDEEKVFIYAKGRKHYGCRITRAEFNNNYIVLEKTETQIEQTRQKKLDTIISKLEKSGLWKHLLIKFKNMKLYSNLEKQKIAKLFCDNTKQSLDYVRNNYSFMINKKENGDEYLDTDYIWGLSELKTKSMYFGYNNKRYKEQIKQALDNKQKLSLTQRVNYDVSFEYNPEKGLAWYSEEYRNCGNGHYYLALDENTALFCEND